MAKKDMFNVLDSAAMHSYWNGLEEIQLLASEVMLRRRDEIEALRELVDNNEIAYQDEILEANESIKDLNEQTPPIWAKSYK
ncbi:hypothetical protein N7535_003379 [Penicillium sp. DV-2018c]|nr:hypothetical protein N7461_000929 [Penicillium sp. DV-2018c]KAJ5576453.1 hypothetical protein N7535_003379 [Penicillium sp. DV-2018c]